MKRSAFLVAPFAMSACAAYAADLPRRLPPPVFTAPAPVFSWMGFYAGVNAGYVVDNNDRVLTTGNTPANAAALLAGNRPTFFRADSDGFTGGGQVGYNYQFGASRFVAGLEADAAYTDLDRTRTFVGPTGLASQYRSSLDYLGTVRGRVGYAFDRLLVYGTGGLAYGGTSYRANFFGPTGALALAGGRDDTDIGYAVGGGVEYALPPTSFLNVVGSSAVTIKAEYLFYDLGRTTIRVGGTGVTGPYSARFGANGDLVRIGLNYKFGS